MSKSLVVARAAGAAVTFVVMSAGLVICGGAANAAPASHTVDYSCKLPVIGTKVVDAHLAVSAPAKTSAGKTVKIGLAFSASGLPAVAMTDINVKSTLTESGVQKGSVTLTEYLPSGNSGNLDFHLSGRVKLSKAGSVHLTAGSSVTFSVTTTVIGKISIACTATSSKLPVLTTIAVSGASGKATAGKLN